MQIAKLVMKHFQEKESQENRIEKDRVIKLQKIASKITKMVMEFWNNAGKVCFTIQDYFHVVFSPQITTLSNPTSNQHSF